MLIIPVLLTVKPQFVSELNSDFVEMIRRVGERMKDASPVVTRTAK
jgi:hypothetical protein